MFDITVDWFIGFLEGEGSFTHSKDGGGNIIPSFQVAQNNQEIIERIKKYLGYGKVYYNKRTQTWYLQIRAHEESVKLMKLIDGKLRCYHKNKQYEKWKNLVLNRKLKKKKWTEAEEKILKKLITEGKSYEEISKILNKTIISVKSRNWKKFNIPYKYDFRLGR